MIDIKVPSVGESINEVTLVKWLKQDGAWVERDELLCELESEKATFELNAEKAGILHTVAKEGDTLNIGDIACKIDEAAARPEGQKAEAQKPETQKAEAKKPEAPKAEEKKATAAPVADVKATPVA